MPARSAPSTIGNVAGIRSFHPPFAICISIGFIPAAWTAMSTWPGPGRGQGRSVTAGPAPYSLTVIVRTITSLACFWPQTRANSAKRGIRQEADCDIPVGSAGFKGFSR